MDRKVAEQQERLCVLAVSPLIWAAHFLLSYCTAAVWCAKFAGVDRSLGGARVAIVAYTVVALVGVGLVGLRGYRRHALSGGELPHDADTSEDRYRFVGFATLLLSGLSAVAIVYAGLAVALIRSCH